MAVSCAKCGHHYDATLFEFGRTINCACGARVEFEHKINLPQDAEIKFFADVNVARLVRWLRAAGFDTIWEDAIPDGLLVRRAIEEERYVLTLDKRIEQEWRADNILILKSDETLEQFAQVVRHFDLKLPAQLLTRCLVCNALLKRAGEKEISESDVPPQVIQTNNEFYYCPHCNKIYWEGSHTERMRAKILEIFEREGKA